MVNNPVQQRVARVRVGVPVPLSHHAFVVLCSQECEDGIPLAYLAGLDECYKNFVKQMDKTQAQCMIAKWDDFGSSRSVYCGSVP